jgi:hypothetical protein
MSCHEAWCVIMTVVAMPTNIATTTTATTASTTTTWTLFMVTLYYFVTVLLLLDLGCHALELGKFLCLALE